MGFTSLLAEQVEVLLEELRARWLGKDYDLLRHNCTHFCDVLCRRLGVDGIPPWVCNLAAAGATLGDQLQQVADSTQLGAVVRIARGINSAMATPQGKIANKNLKRLLQGTARCKPPKPIRSFFAACASLRDQMLGRLRLFQPWSRPPEPAHS